MPSHATITWFGVILMKLYGISINLLSLGGMALAVGMVVDGAVVVIENIEGILKTIKTSSLV